MSSDATDDTSPTDVVFEPATWYAVTARDNTPACHNFNRTFDVNPFYSNDGNFVLVQCGICSEPMEILTATRLDPQPHMT
ncbi:hypothetical protein ACJ6WF_16880 [Streptomyces sp. MMS24-I2-30]|uniref:hypothetical protein n=1 Tax=Streptomyces sp. MMS24-I2-30 TaxID=3351564 RepID=UPI003896ADC4